MCYILCVKDIQELKQIAVNLVDKRQAPVQKREQALASSIAGLVLLDQYDKTPQLEDMDPHGYGMAPIDKEGRRMFLAVREQSPFYFRDQQLGQHDLIVFVTYSHDKVEFLGWLPDSVIPTMPVKLFANSSPYIITADLMNSMPESFDFDNGCDTLECVKPAIWDYSAEGWDCMVCDKMRFSNEARAKYGASDS